MDRWPCSSALRRARPRRTLPPRHRHLDGTARPPSWARRSLLPATTTALSPAPCENAIDNPTVGEPRQPDAIRIADQVRADQVRAEVAGTIPVTVAPTPHPGNRRTDSRARRAVPDPDRFPRRGRTQLLRSRMCLPRRRRDAVHRQRFPLRHHTLVPRRRQPPPPWPWPPSSPSTPRPSTPRPSTPDRPASDV